jgi:hypothetical protein
MINTGREMEISKPGTITTMTMMMIMNAMIIPVPFRPRPGILKTLRRFHPVSSAGIARHRLFRVQNIAMAVVRPSR